MTKATSASRRGRWAKVLESIQANAGADPNNNLGRNDPLRLILRKILKALS